MCNIKPNKCLSYPVKMKIKTNKNVYLDYFITDNWPNYNFLKYKIIELN